MKNKNRTLYIFHLEDEETYQNEFYSLKEVINASFNEFYKQYFDYQNNTEIEIEIIQEIHTTRGSHVSETLIS